MLLKGNNKEYKTGRIIFVTDFSPEEMMMNMDKIESEERERERVIHYYSHYSLKRLNRLDVDSYSIRVEQNTLHPLLLTTCLVSLSLSKIFVWVVVCYMLQESTFLH